MKAVSFQLISRSAMAVAMVANVVQIAPAQAQSVCIPGTSVTPPAFDPAQWKDVVITDGSLLSPSGTDAGFSLERTLGAILVSAKLKDTPGERVALLQSLIRSFGVQQRVNPDGNFTQTGLERAGEAGLDPIQLLDSTSSATAAFRPVGLFNRIDLAPATWKYCGEYRIVYALADAAGKAPASGRMTLIFEAALDNPLGAGHPEGCRPVADFWNGLPGSSNLRSDLETFYYGGTIGNNTFQPVVHVHNYGNPFGQVRGDLFINRTLWQLREWRITSDPNADDGLIFSETTVKHNPLPTLYKAEAADEFAVLRQDFQADLITSYIDQMVSVDQSTKAVSTTDLLGGMGGFPDNKYNAFESTSQGAVDEPAGQGNAALAQRIADQLKNNRFPANCQITATQILNRAGALSCGGCHQFSGGKEVAPGVIWPKTLPFLHIDEKGGLSPALTDWFLPFRRARLKDALAIAPAASAVPLVVARSEFSETRAKLFDFKTVESRTQRAANLAEAEATVETARAADARMIGAFGFFRSPD